MGKFLIFSRILLIAAAIYGVYNLCEKLRPQMDNKDQYIITFIVLLVLVFWSIIDWGVKKISRGGGSQ